MRPAAFLRNCLSLLFIIGALISLPGCFPCMNMECENGICNDGVCDCFEGYYGSECQYSDASSGYDCVSGSCIYTSDNASYSTYSDCENSCSTAACEYDLFSGAVSCIDPNNFPVSTTWCCSPTVPYYCPETGSCYATCELADQACQFANVVTGAGWGGNSGYVCSGGNCTFVSSGGTYASLAQCQSACSGGSFSLNDSWLASSGTGILISGQNGTFYAFSSNWQLFVNEGMVGVGTLKIRNIVQVNANTWNCQTLFQRIIDGVPDAMDWSPDGTLTMSTDGNILSIYATSPFGGSDSETYYRQ